MRSEIERDRVAESVPRQRTLAPASERAETLTAEVAPAITAQQLLSAPARSIRPADVLALQRSVGNRAVQGLLDRRADHFGPRDANGVAEGAQASVDRAASSTGEPLPVAVRASLERSFGTELSGVRVHTSSESAEAAKAVGAKAYTVGQDIHFGTGYYAPGDSAGFHLLAHEVTHTLQSRGGTSARQTKLEVSNPADSAEIEADRAADSILAGASLRIGGPAPVSIHRDDEPPVPKAVDPQPPATNPQPTPAVAPTAGAQSPATDPSGQPAPQVTATWQVDWVAKETGTPIVSKSNVRTGKDAASGEMKINPAGGGSMKIIEWVNASKSGAVNVGSMTHPKDQGGDVSSSIIYGKPPKTSATITVTASADADKKAKQSGLQIANKQKAATAAASAKLEEDLKKIGDLDAIQTDVEKAARSAVGPAPEGYSYDVKVTVQAMPDPGDGNPRSAPAISYDPFAHDDTRVVTITVPTEVQKLKGSAAVESETGHQSSFEKREEHLDDTVTALTNTVTSSFTEHFGQAWQKLKSNAKTNAGSLSGGVTGKMSASTSADAKIKDFEVDIGKLLAAATIEIPPLALLLSRAFGKAKLDGEITADLAGALTGHIEGKTEWSESELKTSLDSFDEQVNKAISSEVKNSITTQVRNATSSVQKEGDEKKNKVASSTETIGIKYIVGDPSIHVSPVGGKSNPPPATH